ncbi:MAG: type III pantothenate kinase [Oscillospiraceae bacterium]
MILAVDAGNTNVVLGCVENSEICGIARMESNRRKTEFEYAVNIERILALNGVAADQLEGAIISSVVPQLTDSLASAVLMVTGHEALIVGAGVKTGLNIGIDDPSQLGADLVAGAVAALDLHAPPLIIIDMGTATTMTVIGPNARVLGGAIMPGPGVAMDALVGGASLLPHIPLDPPKKCICSNTIDCMQSGAVFGTAAAIDGMIDRMEQELGSPTFVVATGGLASKVIPYCRHDILRDENLLLHGLWLIWERNKRR